jgi:hypothetical protein
MNARNWALEGRPNPLPAKMDEWERKIKITRTLNDYVEDAHKILWDESPEYQNYLEAVWDSEAIEGSLALDNVMAATMLREKAMTIEGSILGKKKLDAIIKSLGIVLRRYQFSRKERRNTIEGQIVPGDNSTE